MGKIDYKENIFKYSDDLKVCFSNQVGNIILFKNISIELQCGMIIKIILNKTIFFYVNGNHTRFLKFT